MTTYASAPGFPFILEFDTDDARDCAPSVSTWMDEGRTVRFSATSRDGETMHILVNFAVVPTLIVGTWDPRDGDKDDARFAIPITMDQLERL